MREGRGFKVIYEEGRSDGECRFERERGLN